MRLPPAPLPRSRPARLVALVGVALLASPAAAHAGGLGGVVEPGPVPTWLLVGTGGVLVGASFLFATLMVDHEAMRLVAGWRVSVALPAGLRRAATGLLGAGGLAGLLLVLVGGLLGPPAPRENVAILVVWAAWWAGLSMFVYLVGNAWPALNPWRTAAAWLPTRDRPMPRRWGAWPSVAGLLALVYLEVVSPLSDDAALLVGVVVLYTAVTLAGAVVYGPAAWFGAVDPVARVFRLYGQLAPVARTDDGLALSLPTTRLIREPLDDRPGEPAFVVALLWATTFDGLVSTPAWEAAARPVVAAGAPPLVVYAAAIVAGYWLFLRAYRWAGERSRETASTYVTPAAIRRWFAPSLVPIAAGYHLAHFLGYFLSLSPLVVAALANPLAPVPVEPFVVPDWFGGGQLLFVVGGHVLAVWVAHVLAFELFPGTLTPIRSQYPFIVVMVGYTTASLWVIAQPFVQPPVV